MISGNVQLFAHDINGESSVQEHPLGTLGVTPDGRSYRYGKAGAVALSPGKLCVAAAVVANHQNMAVAAAAAVGATEVTVTLGATAATANQYAGSYLVINDAAGEGKAYLVSGHPAADASASLTVKLAEPVQVALTTSSEASLHYHPYAGVLVSVADQGDMAVGIPNIGVTASYFCWLQTRGVCSALADETLAIGTALTTGSSVVGALEVVDAAGEPQVAVALQAGVDTEYRAVFLQLD